jgi:hypothetical protein
MPYLFCVIGNFPKNHLGGQVLTSNESYDCRHHPLINSELAILPIKKTMFIRFAFIDVADKVRGRLQGIETGCEQNLSLLIDQQIECSAGCAECHKLGPDL